jgi:hypothetical protein
VSLSDGQFEKALLRYLLKKRLIGAHQTTQENLCKALPRGQRDKAKAAFESLKAKGFLLLKHKHYGIHVSINPERLDEAWAFLGI